MLKNIAPGPRAGSVGQSRRLRRRMSLPEILLWSELRKRPGGLKFRRQHPSGPNTLDFYCNDSRLAIEVDGEAHRRGDRPEKDSARDAWLAEAGIATLRIPAIEVTHDLEAALRVILAHATERLPPNHPARLGSPSIPPRARLGEGDRPKDGGGEVPTPHCSSTTALSAAVPLPEQARGGMGVARHDFRSPRSRR